MRFTRLFFLTLVLTVVTTYSFAQNATIRGFVYEKANGEPVLFTNVYLKGTSYGAATDVNGFFSITKIPAGTYTLLITSIEFDTLQQEVTVANNEIITRKLYVSKRSVKLDEISINASRQEQQTEVKTSVTQITPKELSQIPTIGGDPDLVQYLQVVPGVVFTGDQGGQLYIRGGTPVQNQVLLDGMVIYNPFHSIGLFSVFDTDIIRNADVYTGGFGAMYGGRISSVMDIKTRDGNKKRLAGKLSANTFTSKLLLEGPIKKAEKEGGADASFIVSAKTSYLDKTSETLYDYANETGLPYSFNDFYGKYSTSNSNGSRFNLFGFHFDDKAEYQNLSEYNWKSTGVGTSFIIVPSGSAVLMQGNMAYSNYQIDLDEGDGLPRSSKIGGFRLNLNWTYYIKQSEVNYGIEAQAFKTDFQYYNFLGTKIEQEENTTELAAYFNLRKVWDKFVVEPGIRFHYYASLQELSIEPRLGAKYNINDRFRVKAATGLYAQNLLSTVSDRDVVNLFYGFISGPENLPSQFRGESVDSRLQKAIHYIAGFEWDLPYHMSLNVEGYYKDFVQLTNVNRDKLFEDVAANSDQPEVLRSDYIVEDGSSYGMDFSLKYEYKRFYFWAVYSLGYVTRRDEFREYTPHFDRRHNVNLVGSYTFGKQLDWQIDARWNYGSGFPFTQTQGFYEYLDFSGGLGADPTTENGALGILYGPLNAGELPDYHRLDLSVKKSFVLGKNSNLDVVASCSNVYNRANIFYVDRITNERVDQLPILPSLGASITF